MRALLASAADELELDELELDELSFVPGPAPAAFLGDEAFRGGMATKKQARSV